VLGKIGAMLAYGAQILRELNGDPRQDFCQKIPGSAIDDITACMRELLADNVYHFTEEGLLDGITSPLTCLSA
jgi:hypothetical protein